jgi:hypothetical protein
VPADARLALEDFGAPCPESPEVDDDVVEACEAEPEVVSLWAAAVFGVLSELGVVYAAETAATVVAGAVPAALACDAVWWLTRR